MGELLNVVSGLHTKTKRNYIERMNDQKIECMKIGYKYIPGRWEPVARKLVEQYHLPDNAKILDVGCGKGFLLFELKKLLPQCTIKGLDISRYAIDNAKEEI